VDNLVSSEGRPFIKPFYVHHCPLPILCILLLSANEESALWQLRHKRNQLGQSATTPTTANESDLGAIKSGYVQDIEGLAVKNDDFRRVLYTAKNCQLVLMALKSKEEIGAEVHKLDQFFRIEEGTGEAVLNGVRTPIHAGFAVLGRVHTSGVLRQ
jgi:quercetin dioxygenase-like cupin family protein